MRFFYIKLDHWTHAHIHNVTALSEQKPTKQTGSHSTTAIGDRWTWLELQVCNPQTEFAIQQSRKPLDQILWNRMKTWRQIILFLLPENAPSHFTYVRPMVQWSSVQKISERLGCRGGNPRGQNRFHQSMAYNSTIMIIYNSTGNKRTKEWAAMIFHMKYF